MRINFFLSLLIHFINHLITTFKAELLISFEEFLVVFTLSSFVGNPVYVSVISSDPPCTDGNAGFTKVPLKP